METLIWSLVFGWCFAVIAWGVFKMVVNHISYKRAIRAIDARRSIPESPSASALRIERERECSEQELFDEATRAIRGLSINQR